MRYAHARVYTGKRMGHGTHKRAGIMKGATAVALLAVLFVLTFACVLGISFGAESAVFENGGTNLNVAEASGSNSSTLIDLSKVITPTTTSININPDVEKRGRQWTTDTNHTTNGTWTTGNSSTGGTWSIGNNDWHSGTDYANVWWDFDLGEYWTLSDSVSISISVDSFSYSRGAFNSIKIGGAYIAIGSSSSAFTASYSGSTGDGEKLCDTEVSKNSNVTKTSEKPSSANLTHTVSGRYIRIYFVTYSTTGDYGSVSASNVKVTLTRTYKSFNFSYNKNDNAATGSVGNTSHKYMQASNVSGSFFTKANFVQTGWNTASALNGVSIGFSGSIGTSIGSGTIGAHIRSNILNGTTTIPLYAAYQEIGFNFDGRSYATYNNEVLQVLQTKTGGNYLEAHTPPNGYTSSITYKNSNGQTVSKPTAIGYYKATITINGGGSVRGTREISFEITSGDFGRLDGVTGVWGSANNPYVISTVQHLKNLSGIVNGTQEALNSIVGKNGMTASDVAAADKSYANCYFAVTQNIGTSGNPVAITPIGNSSANAFRGTLFGGSGAYASGNKIKREIYFRIVAGDGAGLFGYINGATFDTLTLMPQVSGGASVGGLAGVAEGNCTVISVTVGSNNYGTVTATHQVGGFIGAVNGASVTMRDCVNYAAVTANGRNTADNYRVSLGGFAGLVTANGSVTVTGSRNYGRINSTSSLENSGVGGIVGYSLGTLNISNTFNSGAVGGSQARRVGGIVGHVNKTTTLSNVSNTYYTNTFSAAISGRNYVGGIAGYLTSRTTTLSGNLTNTGSVSGTDTVGGLFGHSQDTDWGNGTFTNGAQGSTATVTGSSTVGGLVGNFFGDRAENATLINYMSVTGTSENTGGIAGKFDWGVFPVNAVNNGAVSGLNNTGGIIGTATLYDAGTHLKKNHINNGSVSGMNNVGGVYGAVVFNSSYPIASYQNRYISGAVNTGNVRGSSLTGGIAGYAAVAIERCKSTATVYVTAASSQYSLPTGAYAGGIVGYATQRIKNCYTSGTVATAGEYGNNYVPANYTNGTNIGGIAGRTDSGAVISYCYTEADVYGGENTGGIVGYMGGGTSYCYFNGDVGSVSVTVSNIGYISGSGANTVSGKNYVLPLATTANNASAYKKAQAYILHSLNLSESGWSFAPRFYSSGTDVNGEELAGGWEEIVNKDVNGVQFIGVYTDGKYIRVVTDRTDTAYSAATSLGASGTTVTARYNLSSSAGDKNVYFDKIDIVCDTVKEYDATAADWVTIRNGFGLPAQYSYINHYYLKTDPYNEINPINANTYTAVTDIIVDGTKVGVKTQDATITKRVITVNSNEWTDGKYSGDITREGAKAFVYKNAAHGLKPISFTHALSDGNVVRSGSLTAVEFGTYTYTLTLADASNYTFTYTASGVQYENADRIVYTYQIKPFDISTASEDYIIFGYARAGKVSNNTALNIDGDYKLGTVNGLRAFLYYDATARAAASYKLKTRVSGSWELLVAGVDYEAFDIPYVDEDEPLRYVTLTYRGINNFTGEIRVEYTLMIGDFGRGDWTSKWGTESNPYLIEDKAQLIRLSQIVNGTDTAWNSIAGINGASAADVNATSASYAGAFFRMTADIDMTGNYGFYPIGTATRPFSATFDASSGGAANTVTLQMVSGTDNVGFFGNLSGATVKNLEVYCNATVRDCVSGANNIGSIAGRMTDSRIINCVGRANVVATGNNVGGIVGYASNSVISDSTNSNSVSGAQNVGGIVGYANNTVISNCVVNARTSGQTDGTIKGTENVGGIVGSAVNVTLDDATADSGTRSYANVEGSEYVGGIAGRFVTNRQFNYTPYIYNGTDSATIAIIGKSFIGGIFGYFTGVGYHSEQYLNGGTALEIAASNIYIKVVSKSSASDKGSYIGGIVGYMSDAGIVIGESGWDTGRAFMSTSGSSSAADFDAGHADLVGGVVGALGHGAAIEAKSVYNGSGQASMPVTQITNNTTITNGGNYVGGIVGYASQNAGAYFGARTTVFGNKIRLRNTRPVSGENYVGGILGYIGANESVNIDGAASASDNTIVFGPRFGENSFGAAQNVANITASGNYAGGIVGYIGKSARVEFVNEVKNSIPSSISEFAVLNGTDVTSNRTIVQAANYAGGIAGYADGESNIVTRVINIAGVWAGIGNTYNGTHAGGLFGYFAGGEISDSMSVNNVMNGNYGDLTDLYRGADYIGGLVGELRGGSISTSYSTGFAFTSVSTSRGGVVGYKSPSAYITDSWTIYRKLDATYLDTSLNDYGKYIIIGRRIALMPSFAEMAKLAGIYGASVTVDEGRRSATGGNIVAQKGKLAIAVSLSAIVSNQQAVMYDASGTETATKNDIDIDETNNVVYLQVDGTQDPFSVCSAAIAFENVNRFDAGSYGEDTDGAKNAQNAYVRAARDDKYTAKVTAAVYDSNRYITSITADIFYKGEKVGSFYSTFSAGSDATPFLITSQDDWDNFASAIISGNGSRYYGKTVRLTVNVEIIRNLADSRFTVNGGYNFAGDITVGGGDSISAADRNKVFTGIFDGDGHSITFRHDYYGTASRVSVFPNAANATFKNLTIGNDDLSDIIYSYSSSMTRDGADGRHIAALVGKPFGALTFENCTNNVNVEGFSVVSGFVGFSTAAAKIAMTACINNGNITAHETSHWRDAAGLLSEDSYPEDYAYGTGGLIAYVNADTTIESCKNTGDITAPTKVGGLIGRATNASSSGKTTLVVYNSANTGSVYGTEGNPSRTGKQQTFNAWGRAGGIIGEVDQNSQLMMYASYNTGAISAFSSIVGGLVGILGTIPDSQKPHSATARFKSTIAYCYNTGAVTAGNKNNPGIAAAGLSGYNFTGTEAGGLVGTAVSVAISYCYNTGVITAYGGVGYSLSWQERNGGIIGEGRPISSSLNITVNNCYNVGMIRIFEASGGDESSTKGETRYSADIVGYLEDKTAYSNTTESNCFGIKNNIRNGGNYYSGWNNQGGGDRDYVRTGTTLDSLADLTAVFNGNSDGPINGMPAAAVGTIAAHKANWETTVASWESSVETLIDANGNDINYANNSAYKNGTLNGWISVYGCLPQLAVFAVGTQSGLSMLSTTYGRNDNGRFVGQTAGSRFSPYVIKDGIDLMGAGALVSSRYDDYRRYHFDGKYIEFADGKNNVATDIVSGHITDTTAYIDMNTYKYSQTADGAATSKGKSYHLYELGAVVSNDPTAAPNTSYNNWKARNYRYNADDTDNKKWKWETGTAQSDINFYAIGRRGHENYFSGSISGLQKIGETQGETQIKNLKVDYASSSYVYAGLFGRVQNAQIKNIAVSGSIKGKTLATNNTSGVFAGIIAYTGGTTTVDGLIADALYIEASENDKNISSTNESRSYTGGIVGCASTIIHNMDNGKQESHIGSELNIKNCVVRNNTEIYGFKDNVGGITGFATANNLLQSLTDCYGTAVNISDCKVLSAKIRVTPIYNTNKEVGTHIGGIIGATGSYVELSVSGCSVGNETLKTPSAAANVTISGENSVGGILGGASVDTTIYSCNVYGDVLIDRLNVWSNAGNRTLNGSDVYGTAFGGIVGYTAWSGSASRDLYCLIGGNIGFYGRISIECPTNVRNDTGNDDLYTKNIGGIAGYMGSGARFERGSVVTVGGSITVENSIEKVKNIGGIVGESSESAFAGVFTVDPSINVPKAINLGGFIGQNEGACEILADDTVIVINGSMTGKENVGGFIGYNAETGKLNIGSPMYGGTPYNGALSITVESTATISGENNVGGIVGLNDTKQDLSGEIIINKGIITNRGRVAATKDNAGGFIGNSNGVMSIVNVTGSTTDLVITNGGAVSGANRIGGVIGYLQKGEIAGSFANTGSVTGTGEYIGGAIGYISNNSRLTASGVNTYFTNSGSVRGGGNYVGGSVGAVFGEIAGVDENVKVVFSNEGTVDGNNYLGGNIGVLMGRANYAEFINNGKVTTSTGVNAIGGSIGIIGEPVIWENEQPHVAVSVTNTHSEYTFASGVVVTSQAPSDSGLGDTEWGGIGGVIGVISGKGNWDGAGWSDNTFYVTGGVQARNINNVGGTIGLVKKNDLTFSGLFAYDSLTVGANNVGGVVGTVAGNGVSILDSFNITISEGMGVTATAQNGQAGGIVGYFLHDDTSAETSYWVKGFASDVLKNVDIKNVRDTVGATATEACFENATVEGEDEPVRFVFTGKFCSDTSLADYLTSTGRESQINNYSGWDDYIRKLKPLYANAYQDGNDNWVVVTEGGTPYTTGTKETGWYFLFATDTEGGVKLVDTNHDDNDDLARNLVYWKRIANSYTAAERANGEDKVPLASSLVVDETQGAPNVIVKGGEVERGFIYATATVNPKSGKYLYMRTSVENPDAYTKASFHGTEDNKFYIRTSTGSAIEDGQPVKSAQNVVIFYRDVATDNTNRLVYNGYSRYVSLNVGETGVDKITYGGGSIVEGAGGKDDARRNSYWYTVNVVGMNSDQLPVEAGEYRADIKIYYYGSNGTPYVVGKIDGGEFVIQKRNLDVKITGKGDEYKGEATNGEFVMTVDNIAHSDVLNTNLRLGVRIDRNVNGSLSNAIDYVYAMLFEQEQGKPNSFDFGAATLTSVKVEQSDPYITSAEKSNSYDAAKHEHVVNFANTQKLVLTFAMKNAATYKMSVILDDKQAVRNSSYNVSEVQHEIEITPKRLTLRYSVDDESVATSKTVPYVGSAYGVTVLVSGWAASDDATAMNAYRLALIRAVSPYFSYEKKGTVTQNNLNYNANGNSFMFGATDVGVYKFGFADLPSDGKLSDGNGNSNYVLVMPDNPKLVLTVTQNEITITWSAKNASREYNGNEETVRATITAKQAFANDDIWKGIVDTLVCGISSTYEQNCEGKTVTVTTARDGKNAEAVFITSKNADKYTFTVDDGMGNENYGITDASSKNNTFTIAPRKLTVRNDVGWTEGSAENNSYIYNTYHQGITKIELDGFVTGENLSNTGAYGEGVGISVALSPSSFKATASDKTFVIDDAIDVGEYSATLTVSVVNSNYALDTASVRSWKWTITPYAVTVDSISMEGTSVIYDGEYHVAKISYQSAGGTGNGTSFEYGRDTVTFKLEYTYGSVTSEKGACNVGQYSIQLAGSGRVVAVRDDDKDASGNYTVDGEATASFEVTKRQIRVDEWKNKGTYVFSDTYNDFPTISKVTMVGTALPSSVSSTAVVGSGTNVRSNTSFVGMHANESVMLTVTGYNKNRGKYTVSMNNTYTVSGRNAAGPTNTSHGNYELITGAAASAEYEVTASEIRIVRASGGVQKVYDNSLSATGTNVTNTFVYRVESVNGGHIPNTAVQNIADVTPRYADKNVGTLKRVDFTVGGLKSAYSNGNYVLTGRSFSANVGTITARALTISLNLKNNGALKTYDATTLFGRASNLANETNMRSSVYRLGQGFRVSGIAAGELNGAVIVTAVFAEAERSRAAFDAYINNVVDLGSGEYAVQSGHYKTLVFSFEGTSISNYDVCIQSYAPTAVAADGNTMTVYDSRDAENENEGKSAIYISIEKKSVIADYSPLSQSYANSDNTPNTVWQPVRGTASAIISSDNVRIVVTNGWMYDNGVSGAPKVYNRYTLIRGKAGDSLLGAELTSGDGKHLNYNLRTQPTLTIGYFVSKEGAYQVGSFAGLMLATHYYKMNFTDGFESGVVSVWNKLCSFDDYAANANIPTDITDEEGNAFTTWDEYFDAYEAANGVVIESDTDRAQYGYWAEKEAEKITYTNFLQVANISGVLSKSDMDILTGEFGSNWGRGTDNLSNFLKSGVGSTVTVIGSIFSNAQRDGASYPFIGIYDGAGYTIDKVNIMGIAESGVSVLNVGMFESVGSGSLPTTEEGAQTLILNGAVRDVHLRNFNIVVSNSSNITVNVGGIIGFSQQFETMQNCSFHGAITVDSSSGTVNAGGIVGSFDSAGVEREGNAIDGAISLGSIRLNGKAAFNAGGVIGLLKGRTGMDKVANTVSMTELFAHSAAAILGGIVGRATGTSDAIDGTAAFITDSIVNVQSGATSGLAVGNVSSSAGMDVSYSELRRGSVSAYNASGEYYNYGNSLDAIARGEYDVLRDGALSFDNDGKATSTYESMRLADMIDIYMLLYSKTQRNKEIDGNTAAVYVKGTSWLVGNRTGTDDSRFAISNQQHVALLREFRFASFEMKNDVVMYTTHGTVVSVEYTADGKHYVATELAVFGDAFYGSVSANGYTIDLKGADRMFESELSGHAVPVKISQ